MNFRKTICAAIVFAIVLSMMLPSVVFAAKDNSPNLPDYDHDLLYERTFDNGLCYPWHTCEDSGGKCQFQVVDVPGQPGNRAFRITVLEPGQNKWSVQMRHRGITLEQGHTYTIKFTVWADKAAERILK
ncbi:chitinase [Acetivibrio straminisolvens JCM 21531]|uniref:Chitinase n=1 Tax=Acetivibrio straminisolvens JCM 21531 TaxID=1294263 RepID=W4V4M6_9FIRM|nr:chitinase [Acetivibrio straminisolvens JCM 21531]